MTAVALPASTARPLPALDVDAVGRALQAAAARPDAWADACWVLGRPASGPASWSFHAAGVRSAHGRICVSTLTAESRDGRLVVLAPGHGTRQDAEAARALADALAAAVACIPGGADNLGMAAARIAIDLAAPHGRRPRVPTYRQRLAALTATLRARVIARVTGSR